MAIRQNSSSGKAKSPRIQVVIPEELCSRLTYLAERESRTVSNMAKVLIQEGIAKYETQELTDISSRHNIDNTEGFRSALEQRQTKKLRGAPRKIKIYKP